MTTLVAFIKRHPVPIYFLMTFAISWGGVLLAIGGPGRIPGTPEQLDRLLPIAILAMLAGPSLTGMLLTGLVSGKAGFRELRTHLFRWRVGARWYAVALLTAPLSMTAGLLVLLRLYPEFLPSIVVSDDKVSVLLFGIVAGLAAGIFEELGWTGFAIPRLKLRYGVLTTGLMVGVLWGAWHLLTNLLWATNSYSGALSLSLYLTVRGFVFLAGQLLAYRLLMVWVYDRTGGSLLVVMLMHASLTATTLILQPLAIAGDPLLTYDLILAAAMWIVVAAVAAAKRGQFSRQLLQKRVA
jgi:CAAX protease family protein